MRLLHGSFVISAFCDCEFLCHNLKLFFINFFLYSILRGFLQLACMCCSKRHYDVLVQWPWKLEHYKEHYKVLHDGKLRPHEIDSKCVIVQICRTFTFWGLSKQYEVHCTIIAANNTLPFFIGIKLSKWGFFQVQGHLFKHFRLWNSKIVRNM